MNWHDPQSVGRVALWVLWGVVVTVLVTRVVVSARRGKLTTSDMAGQLIVLAFGVGGLTALGWLLHSFTGLPPDEQEAVLRAAGPGIKTFVVGVSVGAGVLGAHGLVASFALVGRDWSRRLAGFPVIGRFASGYWALVQSRELLTPMERNSLWLRHAGQSLALLFVGVCGAIIVFGAPGHRVLLPFYWIAALLVAMLVNPAAADRATARRLETQGGPTQGTRQRTARGWLR